MTLARLQGTALCDSDRTLVAENGAVTGWVKTSPFIYCVAIGNDGEDVDAGVFRLQWEIEGGTNANLGSTGAIKYTSSTVLTDNAALQVAGSRVTSAAGLGMTWQNGEEIEDGVSASVNLASDCYTELQFGVDVSEAIDGATYIFRLYNVNETSALGIDAGSYVTVKIAGK